MKTWLMVDYGGVLAEDHVAPAEAKLAQALGAQVAEVRSAISERSACGRALRLDAISEEEFWTAVVRDISPRGIVSPPPFELTELWAACYAIRLDVAEALQEAIGQGLSLGIATNVDRYRERYLLAELRRHSISATVWSSYKIGFVKPSIEYYRAIERRLSQEHKHVRCLYIDDRQTHVDAASSVGWKATKACDGESIRAWLRHQNILQ